jgi:hypothetical protein
MGTMDVETLHRGTLQADQVPGATPGQPSGLRPEFTGGAPPPALWTSPLQSLLSTAHLWQPSIWQKLWSTCPAELACFAAEPGPEALRGAGAASGSGEDDPPPSASSSSLPASVASAHMRVSAGLTTLSRHCTSADAAASYSSSSTCSSAPFPASPLVPWPSSRLQQQGGPRSQVSALVLQELLCLVAALLGAGAAEPGAGAAVRSELLSALGLMRGLVSLSGLSAASSGPSPRSCLDHYCLLSAPDSSTITGPGPALSPPDPPNLLDRLGLAALELLTLLRQQRGSRRGSEDGSPGGPSSPGSLLLQALGGALTEVLASVLSPARLQVREEALTAHQALC